MLLVGFDGSPSAAGAIDIAARLLPASSARIACLWAPPFTSRELRRALRRRATSLDELMELLEHEGEAEAERLAAAGVALATAAGLQAEPIAHRSFGGEGLELARLAERLEAVALVVGSRGLGGVRAVLGSVSDAAVHYSSIPVVVVPHPLLSDQRSASTHGPVAVGVDGSDGSRRALTTAASIFTDRRLIAATVRTDVEPNAAVDAAPAAEVTLEPAGATGSGRAVAGALALHATDVGAALAVVGSRGRSPRQELLLGSVAMALLHQASLPVMVVPCPERLERH